MKRRYIQSVCSPRVLERDSQHEDNAHHQHNGLLPFPHPHSFTSRKVNMNPECNTSPCGMHLMRGCRPRLPRILKDGSQRGSPSSPPYTPFLHSNPLSSSTRHVFSERCRFAYWDLTWAGDASELAFDFVLPRSFRNCGGGKGRARCWRDLVQIVLGGTRPVILLVFCFFHLR